MTDEELLFAALRFVGAWNDPVFWNTGGDYVGPSTLPREALALEKLIQQRLEAGR